MAFCIFVVGVSAYTCINLMGSVGVMMPIADHPDILPDLALEHVAIVLHGHKKLGSK